MLFKLALHSLLPSPRSSVTVRILCALSPRPSIRTPTFGLLGRFSTVAERENVLDRDVAPRMGMLKPALIHSKFFPALQGHKTKMSGSVGNTTIMVTDSPKEVGCEVLK